MPEYWKIDKELLTHVSKIARLKLSEEEIKKFVVQLGDVLENFRKIDEVNVTDVPPLIHPIEIKNVQFDQYGAVIVVGNRGGKTGARRIRLVSSVPHLSNWIEHHSCKDDPESPLWVGIGSKNYGKQIDYHAIMMRLRKIAKKAGIQKRVNPHSFRYARATDLANHLTEAQMKEYFGWTMDSDMASVYVHLSGRDTDEAILRIHGKLGENEKQIHEQLKTKICQICDYENAPEMEFCLRCRRPLTIKALLEIQEKEKEFLRLITSEMLEQMIQKKVEEILSNYLSQAQPSAEVLKKEVNHGSISLYSRANGICGSGGMEKG